MVTGDNDNAHGYDDDVSNEGEADSLRVDYLLLLLCLVRAVATVFFFKSVFFPYWRIGEVELLT